MGQVEVRARPRATLTAAKMKAKGAAAPWRLAKPGKRLRGVLAIPVVLATALWAVTVPASAASPSPPPVALPPTLAGESFTQTTNDESFEFGCGSFLGRAPDGINLGLLSIWG